MPVDKMSISVEADLGGEIRHAAERSGVGVSSWLADAARARLRGEALAEFLADWETEHGPLSPEEVARAEAELGLPQALAS